MTVHVEKRGLSIKVNKMKKSYSLEGVGQGALECLYRARVPLGLSGEEEEGTYDAPFVPDSGMPA
eukprot:4749420-Heterocapsa_arctica.AAC.1